jgi:hypothetical protein
MVVHTKRARQELILETQTSRFQGKGGTQKALSGESKDKMNDRVVKRKLHNNVL